MQRSLKWLAPLALWCLCLIARPAMADPATLQWLAGLVKANQGSTFCVEPSTTTMNDLINNLNDYANAHPELQGHLSDQQAAQALALRYPCAPGATEQSATQGEQVNRESDFAHSPRTVAYIESPAMSRTLYGMSQSQDQKFGQASSCPPEQSQLKPLSIFLLSPVSFPANSANPTSGGWQVRYQIDRCGSARVYNAVFIAKVDGAAPDAIAYFPGTSLAGMRLTKDAMVSAVQNAIATSGQSACKNINVADMALTQPPHNVTEGTQVHNGVWNENWTFLLCGQRVNVGMTFIPDASGGGTSFVAGPVTP
jgi:hypothetical protein